MGRIPFGRKGEAAARLASLGTLGLLRREILVELDDVALKEEARAHPAGLEQVQVARERTHATHLEQPRHRDRCRAAASRLAVDVHALRMREPQSLSGECRVLLRPLVGWGWAVRALRHACDGAQ